VLKRPQAASQTQRLQLVAQQCFSWLAVNAPRRNPKQGWSVSGNQKAAAAANSDSSFQIYELH
jgi:hypothetical protein